MALFLWLSACAPFQDVYRPFSRYLSLSRFVALFFACGRSLMRPAVDEMGTNKGHMFRIWAFLVCIPSFSFEKGLVINADPWPPLLPQTPRPCHVGLFFRMGRAAPPAAAFICTADSGKTEEMRGHAVRRGGYTLARAFLCFSNNSNMAYEKEYFRGYHPTRHAGRLTILQSTAAASRQRPLATARADEGKNGGEKAAQKTASDEKGKRKGHERVVAATKPFRADGMTAGNFSKNSRPRQLHGRMKRGKKAWSSWDG